ncbi:unnamed protein product [Brassicogethes aeneus]|uniref:C-factor n=1 Tax=Brassicogethes aeneus TaxID=1431903 RepID=A0A9P0B5A4_BRAAE|nr:unnamed protein product [Brassicogethes aeneus]
MNSILVTGCNRGLGLGLIKSLVKDPNPPTNIIATCRSTAKAKELCEIKEKYQNVHLLELELEKPETFNSFAERVKDIVKEDGLNVLFNNAGYAPRTTKLTGVRTEDLMKAFEINTVAPMMLTKCLLPLIKLASEKNQDKPMGISRAAIINMSSILSSITLNTKEADFNLGNYPYRCSKAGLNIFTRSLSIELNQNCILVTCIHPGWVKTDMGGPRAALSVEDSIDQIMKFVKNLNNTHNGDFHDYGGDKLPW